MPDLDNPFVAASAAILTGIAGNLVGEATEQMIFGLGTALGSYSPIGALLVCIPLIFELVGWIELSDEGIGVILIAAAVAFLPITLLVWVIVALMLAAVIWAYGEPIVSWIVGLAQ